MLAQAALAQQFDWFMVDCIKIDQRMASKRLLSSEMPSCKRRCGASHPCCGCGESKHVSAKCDQKEPWMRKGAQMRDGSYDVCKAAAKLSPYVVQKRMRKKTCLSQVQFKRPAAAAFKLHIKKLQKLAKSKGQQKVQTKSWWIQKAHQAQQASS